MKKITLTSIIAAISIFSIPSVVLAANLLILTPPQGGTGIGSATAGNIGNCLTVSNNSPFTYSLGSCGGGGSAGNTFGQAWEINGSGYLAPTTTLDVLIPQALQFITNDLPTKIFVDPIFTPQDNIEFLIGNTNSLVVTANGLQIPSGGGVHTLTEQSTGINITDSTSVTSEIGNQVYTTVSTGGLTVNSGNLTLNGLSDGCLTVTSNVVNSQACAGGGTVTSVDMTVPTGLSVSGNPVTTAGTLALTLTSGYSIPVTSTLWATSSANYFNSQFRDWSLQGSPPYLAPTTSRAILVNNATSTITNLLIVNGTTTNATSTNSFSTIASSTNLFAQTASLPQLTTITQAASDNSTKAASTAYVTTGIANAIAAVNPAIAVQAATTVAGDTSAFTYNNGVSGIGATFTGAINTAVTIDGYTFTALNQRLLVKNDTQSPSGAFNGIYYLSTIQGIAAAPIFTRALDYNQSSDINNTGAIPVINGSINGSTSWLLTSSITNVGVDPLTYTKFTSNPTTLVTTSRNINTIGMITGGGSLASDLTLGLSSDPRSWSLFSPTVLQPTTTPMSILVNSGVASSTITNLVMVNSSTTNATTTILDIAGLTSNGFVKTSGSNGTLSVDTNTYLTANQAITLSGVLSGSGTTNINASFAGLDPRSWNEFSGTYIAPTSTIGIIVNNSTSTVTNLLVVNGTTTQATSTNLYVSSQQVNLNSTFPGVVSGLRYISSQTGTTTTWTGTTSLAYVPFSVAPFTGTIRQIFCKATSTQAFLGVSAFINSKPITPSYFVASNTVGTISVTGNNTFNVGDSIGFLAGTTTTDANAYGISCSFGSTQTP